MNKKFSLKIFVVYGAVVSVFFLFFTHSIKAATPTELQTQIDTKKQEKAALDAENIKLQAQIDITSKQAKTLQSAVKTLETTGKKLQNDLSVTSNKLDTTKLTIIQLGTEIQTTQDSIDKNQNATKETLRSLYRADDASLIQNFLEFKNINELWSAVESIHQFQTIIKQKTDELSRSEKKLQEDKALNEEKNKELASLKAELATRKTIVDQNKTAKANLLAVTKDQESSYEKILQANIKKGEEFEQELFAFESQLKAQIDPSKIPPQKSGVLSWPMDKIVITQRFGKTVDAKRLYVSGTHNGVDFGTPVGTTIKSVADGVVIGMDNTDSQPGCYSYGRWLLIQHNNGLSSLYAHLSAYNVSPGQSVTRGTVIGYSGGQPGAYGSGYSSGPHLHLGLFAAQGVKVAKYSSSKFCKNVTIPVIEGLNAYLDPLGYLPPLN